MKIAYNPKSEAPLFSAPTGDYLNAITFDLAGHNIFAKGEMFKGTDTTYEVFKKYTSDDAGGYDGLVPAPSYNGGSVTRFLREDGTWIPISSSYRSIAINDAIILNNDNTKDFNLSSSGAINLNPILDSNSKYTGKVVISANDATLSQSGFMSAADKTKLDNMTFTPGDGFSGTLADAFTTITALGSSITAVAGKQTVTFLPGTGININVNTTDYSVLVEGITMVGASSENDGSSGLVPKPTKTDYGKFLRGDGTWQAVSVEDTKVTQTDTTTNATYRLLLSGTADNTTRTESARKSEKLTFNPNSGVLASVSFVGNLDGTYINALTGYAKATTMGSIAATDSLNTALGKLEFKTDFIYNDLFGTDNDDIINKWHEIVDFIDSVAEGTDILDEFVTRKTDQTIDGVKTFSVQQKFAVAQGTAPFTVDSNTLVTNLNSHLLGGYSADALFEELDNDGNLLSITIGNANKKVTVGYAQTVGNLFGGSTGSIVYQSAANTTVFLEAPEINNMVLKYDTSKGCPYWASDNNSDYRVTNTLNAETVAFITGTTSSTTNTGTQIFDTNVYLGVSPGSLHAISFVGNLIGNADSASKIGTTSLGNLYTPIYLENGEPKQGISYDKAIVSISRSGNTFTYTCVDETTGTFTLLNDDSWRAILVNGTQLAGTDTGTYALNFAAGDGIILGSAVGSSTAANRILITNSGVRSVTLDGNLLKVNTGGTETKLTIPYSTTSDVANKLGTTDLGNVNTPIYLSKGVPTECSLYAGGTAITLNGTDLSSNTATIYAPEEVGTNGFILKSNGSGAPSWVSIDTLVTGVTVNDSDDGTYPLVGHSGDTLYSNAGVFLDAAASSLFATHYYETSDLKFKTNIVSIESSDNIPTLRLFNWKEDGSLSYGFIAQELEKLGYGELVNTAKDGSKTVNYSAALSLTVAKLLAKIEELENQIKELKNG